MGDILLLFELVRKKDADLIPSYPMRPPVNICSLTFSCLGLRELYMTQKGKTTFNLSLAIIYLQSIFLSGIYLSSDALLSY